MREVGRLSVAHRGRVVEYDAALRVATAIMLAEDALVVRGAKEGELVEPRALPRAPVASAARRGLRAIIGLGGALRIGPLGSRLVHLVERWRKVANGRRGLYVGRPVDAEQLLQLAREEAVLLQRRGVALASL